MQCLVKHHDEDDDGACVNNGDANIINDNKRILQRDQVCVCWLHALLQAAQ